MNSAPKRYKLKALPLFESDLRNALNYIKYELHNDFAANSLARKVQQAVAKRLENPLGSAPIRLNAELSKAHYKIRIGNYYAFYVVKKDEMELRRFIYARQDLDKILGG